jgi:tetratricopeptide (TPR) repeat protein/nucleoside phosphorylase
MIPVDVLIITTAKGEDDEVRRVDDGAMGAWEETEGPEGFPAEVWHRSYEASGGRTLRVALVKALDMGGEAAALAAGALVGAYKPATLAMCGVCAGRPGRVNLGDVMIADRVYRYDSGETVQETVNGQVVERLRPDMTTFQISARWKRAAERFRGFEGADWLADRPRSLEHQTHWLLSEIAAGRDPADPQQSSMRQTRCPDWSVVVKNLWDRGLLERGKLAVTAAGRDHLEGVRSQHPDGLPEPVPFQIHVGPIATGNTVVKVPGFFDRLASQQRGVLALEMEASAIGYAAHTLAVPNMIVVKGVMDDASPAKSDRVRQFAARAAAEVLIGFLRQHTEPRTPSAADMFGSGALTRPTDHNPATLLNARYAYVPFDEELRIDELRDLESWCGDPRPVLARLFVGPGGAGKTRLFIEWCERLRRRGWLAGFLREHPTEEAAGILLRSGSATVAVIDYAESRSQLLAFVRALAKGTSSAATRLRIVLLARAPSDWWQSLLGLDDDVRHLLTDREPRRLAAVSAEGPLRQRVFLRARDAFTAALGRAKAPKAPEPRLDLDDPAFGRVLYLHLAALATVEGLDPAAPGLLGEVVAHEERFLVHRYAERFGGDDLDLAEFMTSARRVVAALTLRGGAASRDQAEALVDGIGGPHVSHFVRFLKTLYPGRDEQPGPGRYLGALEPDLLGEHLVERVVSNPETPASYLDRVFEGADAQSLMTGLSILARVSLRHEQGTGWIERVLGADVEGRARPAFAAAMALGEESALSPIGDVLAAALHQHGTVVLADEMESRVPEHTVTLRAVGAWASGRLLAELPEDNHAERARVLNNLGNRLSELGRREEALAAAREAVEHYRELARVQPDAFLPNLAGSLSNLGNRLSDLGRREEALAAAREAVEHYRELAQVQPDAFLPGLATSLTNLGARLSELGRREEALAAAREAVEIRRELVRVRPDAFLPDLAGSLNNLGNHLSELGRREEALAAAREALEIRRALVRVRPDAFLPDLAASLNNLGNRLSELGRREEALAAAREAVEIRRELARVRPDAFLPDLAGSLNNLGARLSELGRREEALAAAREAVEIRRALARVRPDAFLPGLAASLNNLGNHLSELGRQEEALEVLSQAVEMYCDLSEPLPGAFLRYLRISWTNLVRQLGVEDSGAHPIAVRAAAMLSKAEKNEA